MTFRLVIDQMAHTRQISFWALDSEILPSLTNNMELHPDRVFAYNFNTGAGAVGHATADGKIATDGQQGPGTFGKWTIVAAL
jgi:hypothetical protein